MKRIEEMTADELQAEMVARSARGEVTKDEYKELYAAYCAKRKAETQNGACGVEDKAGGGNPVRGRKRKTTSR